MAEEMTRQQAKKRFSKIRDKIRSHLDDIQNKLDYGSDYKNEYDKKVLEFSNAITDYGKYYSDKIAKKEFVMPEISKYNDTTQNKDCCRNTDRFIQEKNNFVSFARSLYEYARVSTIETASFVGYDMADYIEAVESVADNLDRLIALLDDASSSSQDINNTITEYNLSCDSWETFKRQIKSGIRAKIDQFWQTVKDWNATAISVMALHVGCHKNLFLVSFHYYDASNFPATEIVTVEKDHHIDPDKIPTPKNSGNFTFLSWKDRNGNPFDPNTATITDDMWIEGKWKIRTTIDWLLDNESKVVHNMGEFEEGTDCTTAVEGQLEAYNTAWGHMAVVPDIGSFDDLKVSRNNYEFAIKGYTKTFDFGIEYRTKTLEGWSNWTYQAGTKKKLRIYGTYDTASLPINYQKAVEDDYYINEPKTKKITYNTDASDDWYSVTADGAIRFDVCPLYKVRYQDEKGNTVKTVDEIEIGQQFTVDENKPDNWPKEEHWSGDTLYRLMHDTSAGEYDYKGNTLTITGDLFVNPHYEEVTYGTVIFSLNDESDSVWGDSSKDHTYEDVNIDTLYSSFSEINSFEYPTVLEVYMAQNKNKVIPPDTVSQLMRSKWKEDDVLGWYAGDGKITPEDSESKVHAGDNVLVFRGNAESKVTVFCYSESAIRTREEYGLPVQTVSVGGIEYRGYISHTYDENVTYPDAGGNIGENGELEPYWKWDGGEPDKYKTNYCNYRVVYAGYIIPKCTPFHTDWQDGQEITVNTENNLIETQIVNGKVYKIPDQYVTTYKVKKSNDDDTMFYINGVESNDYRVIDGKIYAMLKFDAVQQVGQTVGYMKENCLDVWADYPVYEADVVGPGTYQDNLYYELQIVANSSKSGDYWARGELIPPTLLS